MAKAQVDGYTPRLKKHYEEVVRPKLTRRRLRSRLAISRSSPARSR
jgi:hypothetical protein